MERRDVLRILSAAFVAPASVLRQAVDPLRAVPAAIASLDVLHLIGWRSPRLCAPRWSEAKLLAEPAEALADMTRAAKADGVEVWARSGHRTLRQQRYLWNAKFRGENPVRWTDGSRTSLDVAMPAAERVRRVLAYTAFPGTSRHHWGTDVDIAQTFADDCADLLARRSGEEAAAGDATTTTTATATADGEGGAAATGSEGDGCLPVQRWLLSRGQEFGWHLVYDVRRAGFEVEPWHWSYLPLAVPALARYVEEVVPDLLRGRGVDGEDVVLGDFDSYRERFLLGIHPRALP